MKLRVAVLAMVIVLSACAHRRATTAAPSGDTASDDEFLQFAAMQAHNVIDVSDAVSRTAGDPRVRELARILRADRQADLDRITRAARRRSVQLPTEPDTRHAEALGRFGQNSGGESDREYLNLMASDHEFMLSTFESRAGTANARPVRNAAADALPSLRRDLERTRSMAASTAATNP